MRMWGPGEAWFVIGLALLGIGTVAAVAERYAHWPYGYATALALYGPTVACLVWAHGFWRGLDHID